MRNTRHANHPLPNGKGFSVSRRILVAGIVVAAGFVPTAGHTAGNVAVSLRIATLAYANSNEVCSVSVPAGSSGSAVLNAAIAKGCISGYTTTTFGTGHFVDCIADATNGNRCGDPAPTYARYWAMRENCKYVTYAGIDEFVANQGDELSFTYELSFTAYAYPLTVPTIAPDRGPTDCM